MRVVVAVLLVSGCGSVDNKAVDAAIDGAGSAMQPDASMPACNVTAPFGTPVQVAGVNTTSADVWAWLSPDLLTIYFASQASSTSDRNLYSATRTSPTGAFTNAQPLSGAVNTTNGEDRPLVSPDGLTLYYETTATGVTDIYVATRNSTSADFGQGQAVAVVNSTTAIDWNPFVTADGLTLYLSSNRTSNRQQIYRATRAATTATFGAPTAVLELASTSNDYSPVLSADGREIFFASYRAGNNNNDIWHATRSSPTDGFGTPTLVTELTGTTSDDFPSWLSPDRCTILFTSDRAGGQGGQDIWMATRPK